MGGTESPEKAPASIIPFVAPIFRYFHQTEFFIATFTNNFNLLACAGDNFLGAGE